MEIQQKMMGVIELAMRVQFVCLFAWWYLTRLSTIFQLYHGDQFY